MSENAYKIIKEIEKERIRQIEDEGFTEKQDRFNHQKYELSLAAICYAATEQVYILRSSSQVHSFQDPWPWHVKWDKRATHNKRKKLIIAAALIAAEIERIDRESELIEEKRINQTLPPESSQ